MPVQTHAIRIHEPGGADALQWETVMLNDPGPGEVLLRQTAVGLNFIDVYHRSGLYPVETPFTLGMEGAGAVEAVGSGVTEFKPGDRVAYADNPIGAYAEKRLMPADRCVPVPDGLSDELAAAVMLKGLTAHYLLRSTFRVEPGHTVLIHAAAGGVGLLACQWAKSLGATVIGTVGSAEKAELAQAHGCDHPINYREVDFVERVAAITQGEKCDVVYDSIGADTFMASLDCLKLRGTMVSYGQASGKVGAFDTGLLAVKGSLFLTRPILFHYMAKRADLLSAAAELFDLIERGVLHVEINQRWPLKDAAAAHRALEARQTTGSTVLLPEGGYSAAEL